MKGCRHNCANLGIAAFRTLSGAPTSALPETAATSARAAYEALGLKPTVGGVDALEAALAEHGGHAVAHGFAPDGTAHFFNVMSSEHGLLALDYAFTPEGSRALNIGPLSEHPYHRVVSFAVAP
jgi:hypothetical protein